MLRNKIYKNVVWAKSQVERLDYLPDKNRPGETFSWLENVSRGESLPGELMVVWPSVTGARKWPY